MPSTNGHDPKTAILYARVSTQEQATTGYSLRQQLERLREYAATEGYEVIEEVLDPGQSGASLERPGMDRVRDIVAAGGVSVVLAQNRDRFSREPAYTYLLKREFGEHGTMLRSLNDHSDDSPEGELTDGILDQLAKYERAKIAERSRRGKLRKAREGKIIGSYRANYGFLVNESKDGYEVDEEKMAVVRRIFRMLALEGASLNSIIRKLEAEGVPNPSGGRHWYKRNIKAYVLNDVYRPHSFEEVESLVSPEVAARLDKSKSYGIWWYNCRRTALSTTSEIGPEGRIYRKKHHVASGLRGDPEREVKVWLNKLASLDHKRSGYQEMAAEGLITFDELRAKLADLEETRQIAHDELAAIEGRKEEIEQLERDRDAIVEDYASEAIEALDSLTPEQRHELYKKLQLKIIAHKDGSLTVEGPLPSTRVLGAEKLMSM